MHLVCPSCGTINRVAEEGLAREPICAQCKTELMAARPSALNEGPRQSVTMRAAGYRMSPQPEATPQASLPSVPVASASR